MEHDDICEVVGEKDIIFCLKSRFEQQNIYTYVAKVLLAINPYKSISNLYSMETIQLYREDLNDVLPPHLYAIANRIIQRINLERPQSILLTGETGSGKTKSAMQILTYLGHLSLSDLTKQRISAANYIFDLFGNAGTYFNENSSRFTKLIKMRFCPEAKSLISVQFFHLLLESNRVYSRNKNETNFHIFHILAMATRNALKKNLYLDITENYTYLSGNCRYSNNPSDFTALDRSMENVGISSEKRTNIYKILGAILHLGNVNLEVNNTTEKCQISNLSRHHFEYAARLLNIDQQLLERTIFTRRIEINGRDPITIDLDVSRAKKVVDTLSKRLYEELFHGLVHLINNNGVFENNVHGGPSGEMDNDVTKSTLLLQMLDIAGFESFGRNNHFEQLCINYINEKIQQMFVKLMLKDEEEYYEKEQLEVPKIPFLDNSLVLDVFENSPRGLFKILDDASKIKGHNAANFVQNTAMNWTNNPMVTIPKPNKNKENFGFIIRHFVGDVLYNAENFVNKNLDVAPNAINKICQKVSISGKHLDIITSKSMSHSQSVTHALKIDINDLINALHKTECSFIRCIKPNANQYSDLFDEDLVLSQLVSSGSVAYQQLMQTGFPSHMNIADMFTVFKQNLEMYEYASKNQKEICNALLRSCDLDWRDFKIGSSKVFFRNGKLDILTEKLKDDFQNIIDRLNKIKRLRTKWKIAFAMILGSIAKLKRTVAASIVNDLEHSPVHQNNSSKKSVERGRKQKIIEKIPSKKIKLNSKTSNKKFEVSSSLQQFSGSLTTITIASKDTVEDQLRHLLRQERETNCQLQRDYQTLQKKNLELVSTLDNTKKENERLVKENRKLFIASKSYFRDNILSEHNYK